MNRTAAVARLLRGKIVQDDNMYLRIKDGKLQINATVNGLDSGWVRWANGFDYLSSPNLRVVEPKSKIEEAIERECKTAITYDISRDKDGCDVNERVTIAMRRVVNLVLDEAIGIIDKWRFPQGQETVLAREINALKVKV